MSSRSVGTQCNPFTSNQSTAIDADLTDDGTLRIITPSEHVLKTIQTMRCNNDCDLAVDHEHKEREMTLSSTCLDDDQLVSSSVR